ncbi:MAG TPA: NUDIX hydrolase [Solirubrobacteraceae bacterium]|jgi:8-oxo-dGTP pyrophosphatase MutT (NUDIX family)|nr:NUDIX hydrolase [Solirubrobacteraceae bacterium]
MSSRRASKARATRGKAKAGEPKGQAGASKERSHEPKHDTAGSKQRGAPGKKAKQAQQKAPGRQANAPAARRSSAPARRGGGRGDSPRGGAREFSAGGVVVRGDEVVVIVPTRRAADGSRVLSLPKGHVDPGETPLQAAEREVREETGVVAEPVRELGESRYWYRREGRTIGKSVHFYLFRYVRGRTADHDEEVEEARWIPLEEAEKKLTYPAEREMVTRALEDLKEGQRKDR